MSHICTVENDLEDSCMRVRGEQGILFVKPCVDSTLKSLLLSSRSRPSGTNEEESRSGNPSSEVRNPKSEHQ